ncbi:MAG TPA: hypothetical protein VIW47_11255, partial [Nitrospiraceae bacterium]
MIDLRIELGTRVDNGSLVDIPFDYMATHGLVCGRTGKGKSRFIESLSRQIIDACPGGECPRVGLAIFEFGDVCNNLMAYYGLQVARTKTEDVLKRLHYFRASPSKCPRYDLFKMPSFNVAPELEESFRKAWIHAKVHSRMEVFQSVARGTESFEGMPRLQRVLTNVLHGVAVEVSGKRLAAGEADILLDITHEKHDQVFSQIRPRLPREILGDFEIL